MASDAPELIDERDAAPSKEEAADDLRESPSVHAGRHDTRAPPRRARRLRLPRARAMLVAVTAWNPLLLGLVLSSTAPGDAAPADAEAAAGGRRAGRP